MTDTTPGPDALKTAGELTAALAGMTQQLKAVNARQDRADRLSGRIQHIIYGLIISLVLDVTLTIVVTVSAFQAHSASAQASATVTQLHATQISACQAGNQTLAKQVILWDHIYALSLAAGTPTPAERKTDGELLAFIRETFRARDCKATYQIPG